MLFTSSLFVLFTLLVLVFSRMNIEVLHKPQMSSIARSSPLNAFILGAIDKILIGIQRRMKNDNPKREESWENTSDTNRNVRVGIRVSILAENLRDRTALSHCSTICHRMQSHLSFCALDLIEIEIKCEQVSDFVLIFNICNIVWVSRGKFFEQNFFYSNVHLD